MDEILGILRAVLATAGGAAVQHGLATQDQTTAITGGIVALIVAAWSVYQKKQAKKQ